MGGGLKISRKINAPPPHPAVYFEPESSIYKLGDIGISNNLIGSLSLANGQF